MLETNPMSRRPSNLTWAEVSPALSNAATALTPEALAQVALPVVPPSRLRDRRSEDEIELRIDARFRERFGPWASGWRWSMGEGSIGGGPVRGWCCPAHSIWAQADQGPDDTALRAAAGLLSWRDWIRELADLFAQVTPALSDVEAFEQHALSVLERVVGRTGGEDAWYDHAHQVLCWFLESRGDPSPDRTVSRATRGRFESWCTPPPSALRDISLTLRDEVFRSRKGRVDGLEIWWANRRLTAWAAAGETPSRPASTMDAVLEHTVLHDAGIDAARGERMFDALVHVRERARTGGGVTLAELTGWQRHVLGPGAEVSLRKHAAWAKEGRERYGLERLEQRLEEALAALSEESLPPVARAARVYLDLSFLHPFVDGNARAARLALDFVLTRAGLTVEDPERVLFRLPLPATDPAVGAQFQTLLGRLVAPRAGTSGAG
jgi:hypothetical protein